MKILIKYPTRSRPHQFFPNVCGTFLLADDKENIGVLATIDDDDNSMDADSIRRVGDLIPNFRIKSGAGKGKIEACNRDMEYVDKFDILLLLSDDMICQVKGWDNIIRAAFKDSLDKAVHFDDGFTGQKLMTLAVMGWDYYQRFGYIYHPEYKSLWCDNEMMEVAKRLDKYEYHDDVLFKHIHYSNIGKQAVIDELMKRNESYFHEDKKTYTRRKANNFYLDNVLNNKENTIFVKTDILKPNL